MTYTRAAVERAMKVQEVILRAVSPAAQAPSQLDQNPKKRSGGHVTLSSVIGVKVPGPPKKPGFRIRPLASRVDAFNWNTTK